MSGVTKVAGRDVAYEGPYVKVDGRELSLAIAGARLEVGKADAPTFGQLQASSELRDWLPDALASLGAVIDAALSSAAAAEAGLDTMGRLAAIANAADEFKEALVIRAGAAMQGEGQTAVAKRRGRRWSGLL